MDSINTQRVVLSAFVGSLLFAPVAMGDDTEIYLPDENIWKQPNVLFVMDTSGSMASTVQITPEDYDPTQTYSGNCSTDRIYWRDSSNGEPSCGTDNWITEDAFKCNSAQGALNTAGHTQQIDAGQFRERCKERVCTTRWRDLDDDEHSEPVECRNDSGTHGENDGSADVYATNDDASGWSSDSDDEIYWPNRDDYSFFTGNYLNYLESVGTVERTRLEVVQQIASDLVDSMTGINIGLMRFDVDEGYYDGYNGGFVDVAVDDIESVRSEFKTVLNSYSAYGNTPLSETYWEAARYFRGEGLDFGDSSEPRESTSDSYSGGKYISPIQDPCQNNFIILFTDGLPTADKETDNSYRVPDLIGGSCSYTGDADGDGACMVDLAEFLYEEDQFSDADFSRDLSAYDESTQKIVTYTVGFQLDAGILSETANKGGGKYYTADTYDELKQALTEIFVEIKDSAAMFTSPGVAVDNFNRLQHRNQLYYALFKPASTASWPGNFKRYELAYNTTSETFEIVDVNDDAAIDPQTGFFRQGAQSHWSDEADGNYVEKGGAANELTLSRNIYTYTGSKDSLTDSSNELSETNSAITKAMLGIPSATDAEREKVLEWARGVDVNDIDDDGSSTDACTRLGDPLHGEPILVTYGGTEDSPDITMFSITNDGYLHAFDPDDGSEEFAFVPQDLLINLPTLMENPEGSGKVYGLDGPLEFYRQESSDDGIEIEADEGDKVYVFAGMRRGGRNYYGLDVTDRDAPERLWAIKGGSGDFAELGETWSAPRVARMRWNDGSLKTVLIFGGGYDDAQDAEGAPVADSQGRAIYIVDMETGSRLWWAGPSGSGADLELASLTNSIPGDVMPADINADGLVDIIFASDTAGQVFRMDVAYQDTDNDQTVDTLDTITGGRIANLGGDDADDNRRFYNTPDVTVMKDPSGDYIAITIGSGLRAHPLNTTINDRFYVLEDHAVYGPPKDDDGNVSYTTVTESDLYDATANTIGEGADDAASTARTALDNQNGWFIKLEEEGEKVLGSSNVFNGRLLFTTFIPSSDPAAVCGTKNGYSRMYLVDLKDATPVANFDGKGTDDALTKSDRFLTMKRGGIAPEPQVLLVPKDDGDANTEDPIEPVVTVGSETPIEDWKKDRLEECTGDDCPDADDPVLNPLGELPPITRTYWRENDK